MEEVLKIGISTWAEPGQGLDTEDPWLFIALKQTGILFSSLNVHLTSVSASHLPICSCLVLCHSIVLKFPKGIRHTYPTSWDPAAAWVLNLVLLRLLQLSFDPLIVPYTNELENNLPRCFYLSLNPLLYDIADKMMLKPHLKFIHKVVLIFYLNQSVNQSAFFLKPHFAPGEKEIAYARCIQAFALLYWKDQTVLRCLVYL